MIKKATVAVLALLTPPALFGQATDVDCVRCIQQKEIDFGAIGTGRLQKGSVIRNRIASDAVGMNEVDPTEVQVRVGGECESGQSIGSIGEDGSVTCVDSGSQAIEDHELILSVLEHDMDLVLERMMTCGEYRLYGCTQGTSSDGSVFDRVAFSGGTDNVARFKDPGAANIGDSLFFSIPTADGKDFENLWIGGSSNLTRQKNKNWGAVLVDSCDNPTVELVRTGEPLSSRLRVNSGAYYRARHDGFGVYDDAIETIDVSGQAYGLINHQTPGNIIEACTMVTDQTGLYDVYAIDFRFNVFDGRFDSPWTYQ
jgi:hypothetical protein